MPQPEGGGCPITNETLLWIVGAGTPALIGLLSYIGYGVKRLLDMHENPEKTGFGTVGIDKFIQDNTTAIRELREAVKDQTHYLMWMSEQKTGTKPPPRMDTQSP